MVSDAPRNRFLNEPLGVTYVRTAFPIIFVMGMNGLLAVADALFLGWYVGPDALAAVTLMFPLYMLIVALATLVSSGMSSVLARHLGRGDFDAARSVFASAHGLAIAVGLVLILIFVLFGPWLATRAAGGSDTLADLGLVYMRITMLFSPLLFMLAVNSDALRNEGRVGFMAAVSLLTSLTNMGFNYILIAVFNMGVAGSAFGTVAAQALAFGIIMTFRMRGRTELRPSALYRHSLFGRWREILPLGAPQSLGFVGLALGSAAVVTALQWVNQPGYADTISAYGIATRVMTFAFLPLLGLSYAMQTITGNNYGAQEWARSDTSIRIALVAALIYCLAIQIGFTFFAREIGTAFVREVAVIAEVERILPVIVAMFFLAGPLLMIGSYFQAIGDAGRAAIIGLSKPYLFAIPMTFLLPVRYGEPAIWWAGPIAEVLTLFLTILVLRQTAHNRSRRWGIFGLPQEVQS